MIGLYILLAHLVGDYVLQSDWMATEKTKKWWPAIAHGLVYTIPFILITQSVWALLVICITHIIIDHYRLARHIGWAKNQVAPKEFRSTWKESKATGYKEDKPAWMAVWLMIITDNTIHLVINTAAIILL